MHTNVDRYWFDAYSYNSTFLAAKHILHIARPAIRHHNWPLSYQSGFAWYCLTAQNSMIQTG